LSIIRRTEEVDLPANPVRLSQAVALAAGAVLVLPASVSAAEACVLGDWRLTEYRSAAKGRNVEINAEGGEGARLSLTGKTASYGFDKAKKVVTKGNDNGDRYVLKSVYKKRILFKSTLKGSKKGTLVLKRKTATGDATVKHTFNTVPMSRRKLAKHYRDGDVDPFIPVRHTFTCSGRTLKLAATLSDPVAPAAVTAVYRRL